MLILQQLFLMISKIFLRQSYSTVIGNKILRGKQLLVTDQIIRLFSIASKDMNPLHLDEQVAKKSIFKQRIAHGMIGISLLEYIFHHHYQGYELGRLSCIFKAPVYIDDQITAILKQTASQTNNIEFQYQITKSKDNKLVITGNGQLQIK